MALYERQPDPGLLHHSDRGSQYASDQIRQILAANHIQVSMSRTANCYDNAVMESFFSTLKCEWVHHQDYKTRTEASRDIFDYIAGFYNTIQAPLDSGLSFTQSVRDQWPAFPLTTCPLFGVKPNRRRVGAWAGIIGPVLFVTIFTLEGWLRPGYKPFEMFVSALSLGTARVDPNG